jgi:hypothetical protein
MSENLQNFENLKEKKSQSKLSLLLNPLTNWPDALDHLAIGFVTARP